ncbi:MAG: response regulator [Pyrinomonadaceae bacterium]
MRLEFEPNVTAFPLVENEVFEDVGYSASQDFALLLKKGISAAQHGEREYARILLNEAAAIEPRSENAWMWLASISDYPEELMAFLDHVLEINPENPRAIEWRSATTSLLAKTFVGRAETAHEQGNDELAEQCINQAIAHDNDCEAAWFLKAMFSQSDEQKLDYLECVLEINPENNDALNAIAEIKRARSHTAFANAKTAAVAGKRKKAIELVDEFLQSVPDNAEGWILRSHLSIGIEEKIWSLEKALETDPDNTAARAGYDFLKATFAPESSEIKTAEVFHALENAVVEDDAELARQAVEFFDHVVLAVDPEPETVEHPSSVLHEASKLDVFEADPNDYVQENENVYLIEDLKSDDQTAEFAAEPAHFEESLGERPSSFTCPFCISANDPQTFECKSCRAFLTLADIESLLSNTGCDRQTIQNAVTQMEGEWNLREFSELELISLAIGHFNLNNLESGLKYLQEASRLNPNNVILTDQVNTIAIRIGEIFRQAEALNLMPKGKTILIVDDSPTVRKLISGKLEKSGHNVVCAVDGVDALARLDEGLPDLVLLDITMPRMDGYEVCKRIRSNPDAKDIPVVMISGKDGFFDKVRGRMAGTTGYVTKPFGPETLMKALETYLLPDQG